MNNIELLLASFGINTLLMTALGTLLREWLLERLKASIKSQYDHELELYKSDLKRESDVELEKLRSQLAIRASERNTRFSLVFEKTADVIAKTYGLLVEMQDAAQSYSEYLGADEHRRVQAARSFQEKRTAFSQFYEPNQIYIPKDTRERIRHFFNGVSSLVLTTSMMDQAAKAGSQAGFELSNQKIQKLFEEVPQLREALDDEFQKQLGLLADGTLTKSDLGPKT